MPRSKWFNLQPQAISLRKSGLSIRTIEDQLKIPRSTLSGWFRNIKLTAQQNKVLFKKWQEALDKARVKAREWHNNEKAKRLEFAKNEAENLLDSLNISDPKIIELALAMLYLGEGTKGEYTAIGNSDPLLLRAFVKILHNQYKIPLEKIKCDLYLRADQDTNRMIRFWSSALDIKRDNFKNVNKDKRTIGSKTYADYKGVCMVRCGTVAIQRKLLNISRGFCERTIEFYSKRD